MSKVFICAAIPDELATREEGAVAVATAIEAGDERRARAKFHWQFLEHYPCIDSLEVRKNREDIGLFGI